MKSLTQHCNDYLDRVMPRDAGTLQRRETKIAFLAGALAAASEIMLELASSEGIDAQVNNIDAALEEVRAEFRKMGYLP